jgi:hypothetical protein
MFFKVKMKTHKAEINKGRVPEERLAARAERLVDILKQRPKHPKYNALMDELESIMSEMRVREEDAVAFLTRLEK